MAADAYTDAQPIDYTQGMDYSPQPGWPQTRAGRDTVPLACESTLHPAASRTTPISNSPAPVSRRQKGAGGLGSGSARHALITAKPERSTSLYDEARGIVRRILPAEADDSGHTGFRRALRGALDLAVGWADPRKRLLRPQGDLALDDGMETATDDNGERTKPWAWMDGWIDETRDPKRPIYNADDYDPRHGPVLP